MNMKVYTVRKDDTPQKIAQGFTGNPSRFGELIRANPQLRTKIVGRDMQTGKMVVTFMDSDFKRDMKIRIPDGWVRSGSVGAVIDESYGDDPGTKTVCSFADICNPATDCWDEAACAAGGGKPGSNFCNNPNMIKTVQQALVDSGYDVGPHGVDGSWGCDSQKALDASGQSFKALAGQECQGPVPTATGCGGGGGGPLPKKKEGEACTGTDECEAGLVCQNGKCAKELQPAPKTSNLIWWILGGLGAGAAIVGMAYAGGAFEDKGKAKKAAAA
jgi:hypothetical protein